MPHRHLCLALLLLTATALPAQTYTESVLHSFNGTTDGTSPLGLIQASDGNFYGTTGAYSTSLVAPGRSQPRSGSEYYGTIFKMTPSGTLSTLYTFCAAGGSCPDGSAPVGGLTEGPDGNLYGTTDDGGATGYGSIFQITFAGTFTTLYSFCPLAQDNCPDGANPYAPLVVGSDGNLYGSNLNFGSSFGGGNAAVGGTVFRLALPAGTTPAKLTTVTYLCQQTSGYYCVDGNAPLGALLETADGTFYGTTSNGGGTSAGGTIFQVTSASKYKNTYTFCSVGGAYVCTDGSNPESALVQGSNGDLYGSTASDGTSTGGTIFSLVPGSAPVTLHNFCTETDCADGYFPKTVLFGTDGLLYGVVVSGGDQATDAGTLVKFASTGAFSVIYTFCNAGNDNCPDGAGPLRFLQGADGSFYGTTAGGGASGDGTIYKLTPSTALAAPVKLTLGSSAAAGSPITLDYKIIAAYSTTLQQCYAYATLTSNSTVTPLGKLAATFSAGASSGSATFTAPSAAGSYIVGLTCAGSQSGTAPLTVTASTKVNTTTTLAATPNPASTGQTVTFNATVKKSSGSGTPTGQVAFYYGTFALGTVSLNGSGVASFSIATTGLPPGSYPVTASYAGDATDAASTSPAADLVLKQDATTTTLAANPATVTPPASVTFTAAVKRSGITGTPTGQVTFYFATTALTTASLNNSGVATYTVSTNEFPAGSYALTAKYSGDSNDAASTSSPASVTVK